MLTYPRTNFQQIRTKEPDMSLYTCITCRVGFIDGDLQRGHYKTDWHRYNLKRKVADLPPVSADTFQQKVLAQKAKVEEESKDDSSVCELCSKHFSSGNAYKNHLQSKKHKEAVTKQAGKLKGEVQKQNEKNTEVSMNLPNNEKRLMKDCVNMALKTKMETRKGASRSSSSKKPNTDNKSKMEVSDDEESDAESCDSWDEDTIGLEECLFCSFVSKSLEENLKHMTFKHGFFLPDAEYITDLEGLITYLGEKVGVGHLCLWCNEKGKSFYSTQAVQKHMIDKGHCKLLHEEQMVFEYADYYDYRSSYPDYREEEDMPGLEGEEGAAGASLEDVEMEEEVDEEVQPEVLSSEGYELVLPSGATIGHRSLQRYYRQSLPQRQTNNRTKALLPGMLAQYKALGWTGCKGEVAQKRVKDLAFMQRLKTKHHMTVGIKANKLQKHFRCDNFGI